MKLFNQLVVLNQHPMKHLISNKVHYRLTNSCSQVNNKEFSLFAYFSLNQDYWSRPSFSFLHCHAFSTLQCAVSFSLIVLLFVYSLEWNASNNSQRSWFKARLNYRQKEKSMREEDFSHICISKIFLIILISTEFISRRSNHNWVAIDCVYWLIRHSFSHAHIVR